MCMTSLHIQLFSTNQLTILNALLILIHAGQKVNYELNSKITSLIFLMNKGMRGWNLVIMIWILISKCVTLLNRRHYLKMWIHPLHILSTWPPTNHPMIQEGRIQIVSLNPSWIKSWFINIKWVPVHMWGEYSKSSLSILVQQQNPCVFSTFEWRCSQAFFIIKVLQSHKQLPTFF